MTDLSLSRRATAGETPRRVSVVVPAYNEEALFTTSMTTLCDYLDRLDGFSWELVVVDDGSDDATGRLADELAAERSNVRVLHHTRNERIGAAVRHGIALTSGEFVVTFDCDLSYSPEHIGRMLERICASGSQLVVASPYMRGGSTRGIPPLVRWRSRLANRLLSRLDKGSISTVTGLVRVYDGPLVRSLDLKAMDIDVNVEILYKVRIMRGRVEEIPALLDWSRIRHLRRRGIFGARHRLNTWLSLVNAYLFRPYLFYVLPGSLLLGTAMAVFLVTPPAGALLAVMGVLLEVGGLLSLQMKRYFEELFHLNTRLLSQLQAATPAIWAEGGVWPSADGSASEQHVGRLDGVPKRAMAEAALRLPVVS